MPWTVSDVDKFKKGLTTSQKKRWVKIANSVLTKCKANGGSEEDCAASAVRQASGVVGHKQYLQYISNNNEDYEIREVMHQDRKYLVVPVVMMVEGVHNGSLGAIFHSIGELGRMPGSWNGIPIVVDHPKIDGEFISANIPEIIEQEKIGIIYNTYIDEDKIRAEAWLDEDKLRQVSPVLLSQIQEHQVIEVSVGIFTEDEDVSGEWEGEEYEIIARNHRPDHLALLPGGVGACSVSDGCGIRSNKLKKKGDFKLINEKELVKVLKSLKDDGYVVDNIIDNLSEGLSERLDLLRRKIDSMDTSDIIHFLHEAYDDYAVYEVRMRIGGSKLYKQSYQINNNVVEFTGDAEEVYKKVEYISVQRKVIYKRTKNLKKEIKVMGKEKECIPCKEKIDALIVNEQGHYSEKDREWLENLEESQLDKIIVANSPKEKIIEKEVNILSDEDKAALVYGKKQLEEKRQSLVKGIQSNTEKDTWSDAELNALDNETLEKIHKSVYKEEAKYDFSLNTGGGKDDEKDYEDRLYPPGVEIEAVK